MGKFTGVLLASDFDNTLIHTEPALRTGAPIPPLSDRNRKALEYFMAEGGRFAVATGRALAAFMRYVDVVPMNTPGIVCNGAALYDFDTNEYLFAPLCQTPNSNNIQISLHLHLLSRISVVSFL